MNKTNRRCPTLNTSGSQGPNRREVLGNAEKSSGTQLQSPNLALSDASLVRKDNSAAEEFIAPFTFVEGGFESGFSDLMETVPI